ncbi:SRPBCC domain-containing protein [bacterium]|nr:SRPBCC domain-containing protein [bacterium]
MVKFILFALIFIAVLFVVIRDKKPVAANAEIMINAPIKKIWEIQTNLSGWKNWNSDIQSMQVTGDVGLGTNFTWKAGGITIESTITEYSPYSKIAWKGKTIGINAYHTWQFTETENGTLAHTEEAFTGVLAWLMPGTMRNQIEKALAHGVKVLKQVSENSKS